MSDYELLVEYLSKNLAKISRSALAGLVFDFPNFELMPFDYLEFAEQQLSEDSAAARIGCVSNLKLAGECEMDILLHVLGLSKYVKTYAKKLEITARVGLISPRSLEKLNRIREKMERQYSVPDMRDVDAYFDLTTGFIQAIEGHIFMLVSQAEQQWRMEGAADDAAAAFEVKLKRDPPQIDFVLRGTKDAKNLLFNANELETYLGALKAFFLLCRASLFVSNAYVVSKLTGAPLSIRSGQ